jgi:glutathione synthase/RimK-type ligase-like ATP-grasp enzyme
MELLRKRGALVDVIEPRFMTTALSEIRVEHDLYIIKSISNPMAASYNATLHALGATTFNPLPVVQRIRNKIPTTRLLAEHGVPVPETYVSSNIEELVPLLNDGPLMVKPYNGSGGVGVNRVATAEQLKLAVAAPPFFAQRIHPSDDGLDQKISVVGDKVFGVKRIFPLRTYEDKFGIPLEIDDRTRRIAKQISKALNIDLFSFDLMISGGEPYVVDVGAFGSMMGSPDAPTYVAERIIRAWEERSRQLSALP